MNLQKATKKELLDEIYQLRKKNSLLIQKQKLFYDGPVVVFKWLNKKDWPVEYVSPNVSKIFGFSEDDFYSRKILYSDVISDQDLEQVKSEVQNICDKNISEFDHIPYRIKHKDGTQRWLYDHTIVVRDENNNILFFYGYVFDITNRKNFDKNLEEIQYRYEETQKLASLGSWTLDIINDKLEWSPEVYRIFKVDRKKVSPTYQYFLKMIHPDDRKKVNENYLYSVENHKPYDITHRLLLDDGCIKYVRERCKTIYENEKPIRSIGTIQDISEYKQAELLLLESCKNLQVTIDESENTLTKMGERIQYGIKKQLETEKSLREYQKELENYQSILHCIAKLSNSFLHSTSWKMVIQKALSMLGHSTKTSRVYLFENFRGNRKQPCSRQLYEWCSNNITPQIDNPILQNVDWQVMKLEDWYESLASNNPINRQFSDYTEIEHEELDYQNILSILLVPVFVNNSFWGIIGFDECVHERKWTNKEVDALESAAGVIGGAIERENSKQALLESEQRFRGLVESTNDWIWEVNKEGVYTYSSPSVEKILGYRPEEVIGKTPFDFMPPEESMSIREKFTRFVKSGRPFLNLENINYHKDGTPVAIETSGVPIFDSNGNISGFRGIDRDISERKREEKNRLKQLEKQKNELIREVHHRIKNHLQGLMGLLKQRSIESSEFKKIINETITQIESIAIIYGLQAVRENSRILFSQMVEAIIKSVSGITDLAISFNCAVKSDSCEVDPNKSVSLALVVNELIVNAIKHYNYSSSGQGIIICYEYINNNIILKIINPGSLPDNFNFEKGCGFGTGLELLKAMLPGKGADISMRNEDNTVVVTLKIYSPLLVNVTGD